MNQNQYKKSYSINGIVENHDEIYEDVNNLDQDNEVTIPIHFGFQEDTKKTMILPKSSSLNELYSYSHQDAAESIDYYKHQYSGYSTTKLTTQSMVHCNNCGKQGHLFHQCKLPITSYGMIVCRSSKRGIEFLMIRRKDSFGYIDFMRGKYSPYNLEQLQTSINEMSLEEKSRILDESFDTLWKKLWGSSNNSQYRNEEMSSSKKFQLITNGVVVAGDEKITLSNLVESSTTSWEETEWEFPKGRRNNQEKDLDCALREFQEETGYSTSDVVTVENILPFEEIFIGSNHKSYKHKYFLGYMNKDVDSMQSYQESEVSKIEWKTIHECLESIRPYNLEKKKIITNVYKTLQQYKLYKGL